VSRYQKGEMRKVKTNLDLLEQEIVSGSGICWAICKSAPHSRQPCKHPTCEIPVVTISPTVTESISVECKLGFPRTVVLNVVK